MSKREIIWQVRPSDLRVDTFRSGGPGGQHQNTSDSGVRITHLESGLSAESREHKSQLQNKKEAFNKLAEQLIEWYSKEEDHGRYAAGKEVVRTYNECTDRIKDHDTGKEYSWKHTIGKGKMDQLIDERREELLMRGWNNE